MGRSRRLGWGSQKWRGKRVLSLFPIRGEVWRFIALLP